MLYWITLIFSFVVLVISLFFLFGRNVTIWKNETLGVTIFIACVSLICLITF